MDKRLMAAIVAVATITLLAGFSGIGDPSGTREQVMSPIPVASSASCRNACTEQAKKCKQSCFNMSGQGGPCKAECTAKRGECVKACK